MTGRRRRCRVGGLPGPRDAQTEGLDPVLAIWMSGDQAHAPDAEVPQDLRAGPILQVVGCGTQVLVRRMPEDRAIPSEYLVRLGTDVDENSPSLGRDHGKRPLQL